MFLSYKNKKKELQMFSENFGSGRAINILCFLNQLIEIYFPEFLTLFGLQKSQFSFTFRNWNWVHRPSCFLDVSWPLEFEKSGLPFQSVSLRSNFMCILGVSCRWQNTKQNLIWLQEQFDYVLSLYCVFKVT